MITLPVDRARQAFIEALEADSGAEVLPSKYAAIAFLDNDTCLDPVVTGPE